MTDITATEAKNRLGQVLEQAQKRPVFIEKQGRRHSVVMSVEQYERLVAAARPAAPPVDVASLDPAARAFYEQYKDWVDEQNARVAQYGVWNEEFRGW
jgi:prevent-host-death family protein